MNFKKAFLIFSLLIFTFDCYSQQIENVDFTVTKDNIMIVTYDLTNGRYKELYDIKLTVVYGNSIIVPVSVAGDISKVSAGNNKKIEWNVLTDKSEIKGKIQAVVEISRTHSTKITGGPSNAFLSMLLPGLGDWGVLDKGSTVPISVTGAFLGSLYLAYNYKIESDKYYKQYHSQTLQSYIDESYKKANDNYQYFQIMMGVAGAIWLGDVIFVTVKGFQNRRDQLNGYTQNSQKVNFYFAGTPNSFQFGLVKKF
jgi:hypothetical protein